MRPPDSGRPRAAGSRTPSDRSRCTAKAASEVCISPHHHRHGGASELGGVDRRASCTSSHELLDVIAVIAVLGHLLAARQRQYRLAELAHLRAGVVDVELALHLVAVEGEQTTQRSHRKRRCVRGRRASARSGWPRRTRPGSARAARPRRPRIAPRRRAPPRARRPASESARNRLRKPGPGHLEALEARAEPPLSSVPETLGDLRGGGAHDRRQQQRGVGRVVAEIRAWWTLERDRLAPVGHVRRQAPRRPTARRRAGRPSGLGGSFRVDLAHRLRY